MDRASTDGGRVSCREWFRGWMVWSLPRRLRAFVLTVIAAYLAWLVVSASDFRLHPGGGMELFAGLLVCVAVTVELTRRASESASGVIKDAYAIWELPVVVLLPPLYALVIPAVRIGLTQWRVRQAPVYRRVFSVAAIGLSYGCASAVFRAFLPAGSDPRTYLWNHTAMWLLAAAVCAATQWAVNQVLVLPAIWAAQPGARIRDAMFGRETAYNDATELCVAVLVTLGLTTSSLTLIIALPLATLLQRAFRHNQLLQEARADAKTGLLNAAAWEREATAEVVRAVRTGTPLAVAVLDLDRFKRVNDTYGHLLGDQVLRGIAATMTEVLRNYDLAGRFGGEEFVMLLPHTRAVDALRIAERVRAHISRLPVYANGPAGPERVPITVSIGVAALDAGTRRELPELLSAADAALYRAKASGRDQVQMISTSRGLSAVRPPAPAAEAPSDGGAAGDGDGAPDQTTPGGGTPPGEDPPLEDPQLEDSQSEDSQLGEGELEDAELEADEARLEAEAGLKADEAQLEEAQLGADDARLEAEAGLETGEAQLEAAQLEAGEGTSTTATTSAPPVWHSEALPVRSTSGVR
jgi:diguanylate cyclase (GGDEF)-like protein